MWPTSAARVHCALVMLHLLVVRHVVAWLTSLPYSSRKLVCRSQRMVIKGAKRRMAVQISFRPHSHYQMQRCNEKSWWGKLKLSTDGPGAKKDIS